MCVCVCACARKVAGRRVVLRERERVGVVNHFFAPTFSFFVCLDTNTMGPPSSQCGVFLTTAKVCFQTRSLMFDDV